MHLFNKCILNSYCVPGTFLDPGEKATERKKDKRERKDETGTYVKEFT